MLGLNNVQIIGNLGGTPGSHGLNGPDDAGQGSIFC